MKLMHKKTNNYKTSENYTLHAKINLRMLLVLLFAVAVALLLFAAALALVATRDHDKNQSL